MALEIVRNDKDNSIIYKHFFNNLTELVAFIQKGDINRKMFKSLCSETATYEFTKTNTLQEAIDLCLGGDNETDSIFLESKSTLDKCFPVLTQNRQIVPSHYGFRPNVPALLRNNPKSMYRLIRREEYKFVDMYFNCACSRKNSSEAIFNRGIITLSIISFLEQMNYRVNLNFFELAIKEDIENIMREYIYTTVNIKEASQPLEPSICNFPMCHPAFLRRILFAVLERTPVNNKWYPTYGLPLNAEKTRQILNLSDDAIIIDAPDLMNVTGEDIKKDTIKLLEAIKFNDYMSLDSSLDYDAREDKFVLTKKNNQY